MKSIIIILFILLTIPVFAQKDTTYFFGVNGKITSNEKYERKIEVNYTSGSRVIVKTYKFENNRDNLENYEENKEIGENVFEVKYKGVDSKGLLIRKYMPVGDTVFRFTDTSNDKVVKMGYSKTKFPLILHGTVAEYYENGSKMSESVFSNNELISDRNWDEDGKETVGNVFYSVDEVPRFLTGIDYMNQHILKIFKDYQIDFSKVTGRLVVGFVVSKDGNIEDVRVVKSLNNRLDLAAVKAFDSLIGEWVPATLYGKPVNYFQLFPINFSSTENKIEYLEFDGTVLKW